MDVDGLWRTREAIDGAVYAVYARSAPVELVLGKLHAGLVIGWAPFALHKVDILSDCMP